MSVFEDIGAQVREWEAKNEKLEGSHGALTGEFNQLKKQLNNLMEQQKQSDADKEEKEEKIRLLQVKPNGRKNDVIMF